MFEFLKNLFRRKPTRKEVSAMRTPPKDLMLEWADTFMRLSREGYTDKQVEEMMKAFRRPECGPCEPTAIVHTSSGGVIKIHQPLIAGQELV